MNSISIIMPVYNAESTVQNAIDSILKQSFSNIELIIVNDGSTDNTPDILRRIARNDKRIILIEQNNEGQARARNNGLKYATGEYIMFVDSDDSLEPDALLTLVEANDGNCDFIIFGFNVYKGSTLLRTPNPGDGYFHAGDNYKSFVNIEKLMASVCNKFYKKQYITKFFIEDSVFGEDSIFNYENFTDRTSILCISSCLYNVQLGTLNSVNKRYKCGKLCDLLKSREIKEVKEIMVFGSDYPKEMKRIEELNTLSYTIYSCCTKLGGGYTAVKSELIESQKASYLPILFKEIGKCKLHDKIILRLYEWKWLFILYMLCKFLNIFRK